MGIEKVNAALESSDTWLGSAKSNFRDTHYSVALYSLEMAAEIALKAVLLSVNVNVPKVHDVSSLVIKYSEENKKLNVIKENEKFIRDVFLDLLTNRNSAGYMFEYRKSEEEFKKLVIEYLPKTERFIEICKKAVH